MCIPSQGNVANRHNCHVTTRQTGLPAAKQYGEYALLENGILVNMHNCHETKWNAHQNAMIFQTTNKIFEQGLCSSVQNNQYVFEFSAFIDRFYIVEAKIKVSPQRKFSSSKQVYVFRCKIQNFQRDVCNQGREQAKKSPC